MSRRWHLTAHESSSRLQSRARRSAVGETRGQWEIWKTALLLEPTRSTLLYTYIKPDADHLLVTCLEVQQLQLSPINLATSQSGRRQRSPPAKIHVAGQGQYALQSLYGSYDALVLTSRENYSRQLGTYNFDTTTFRIQRCQLPRHCHLPRRCQIPIYRLALTHHLRYDPILHDLRSYLISMVDLCLRLLKKS